jgi:hypothetical protein
MSKKKSPLEGKFGLAEGIIKNLVIDSEYTTWKSNNNQQYSDYESVLDMVELVRSEKNYDWNSDIFIGLLLSHMLTDSATWAQQDFQSRDFVDIYLEGNQPDDKMKAKAAKTLINQLLNIKDVYHFHKRIRARTINWLYGQVYAIMWPEQEVMTRTVQPPPLSVIVRDFDEMGNVVPKQVSVPQEPQQVENVVVDRINYDVFDARNVFTDFSYSYSIQQKSSVILRSEKRFSQIKADGAKFGYFNMDVLQEKLFSGEKNRRVKSSVETDTSKESFNKLGGREGTKQTVFQQVDPSMDILDRYGSIWAKVKERDPETQLPITIEPGYDDNGVLADKAEMVEAIITFAGSGSDFTLIGFRPTWAIDAKGKPYKPIIRGWCYIHPTKDTGLSDGKNLREMNIAANDTFNISNDRVMLATLPSMIGRRDAIENNPTVLIKPEHITLVENIETDLKELKIRDNVQGAMETLSFIKSQSSELDAIFPTTMGGLPEKTSTTATAIAGAEGRTNARGNLKGLTWTYTFDVEFYQMMLQMAYRFMRPETIEKMLGKELSQFFDPNSDYTYVPISENIEGEHQKMRKVQVWDQMMGRIMGLAKIVPKEMLPIISMIIGEEALLMGSEYREIATMLRQLSKAQPQPEGQGATSTEDGKPPAVSNQNQVEQSTPEMGARGTMQ